jgi:hypothetical protein
MNIRQLSLSNMDYCKSKTINEKQKQCNRNKILQFQEAKLPYQLPQRLMKWAECGDNANLLQCELC